MKTLYGSLIGLLVPGSLLACPMCNAGSTDQTLTIIGTFLALPFVVFSVALIAYLNISKKENQIR